ncbi:hypothetical protein WA026_014844, partial [Henosepilachna vigintioctopunctata]
LRSRFGCERFNSDLCGQLVNELHSRFNKKGVYRIKLLGIFISNLEIWCRLLNSRRE